MGGLGGARFGWAKGGRIRAEGGRRTEGCVQGEGAGQELRVGWAGVSTTAKTQHDGCRNAVHFNFLHALRTGVRGTWQCRTRQPATWITP